VTSDKLGYASPAELRAQEQRQWRRVTPGAGDVREEGDRRGQYSVLDTLFALHLGSHCCTGLVRACVQCKSRDGDGCTNQTRCVRCTRATGGGGWGPSWNARSACQTRELERRSKTCCKDTCFRTPKVMRRSSWMQHRPIGLTCLKDCWGGTCLFSFIRSCRALRIEKEGMNEKHRIDWSRSTCLCISRLRVALTRSCFPLATARLSNRKSFVFDAVNKRSVQRALLSVRPAPT
jgi:hypothetical protein